MTDSQTEKTMIEYKLCRRWLTLINLPTWFRWVTVALLMASTTVDAQEPRVIKVRMDQNVVSHNTTNQHLRKNLIAGLQLWVDQTRANVRFEVVDSGGANIRVRNKEVYLGYGTYNKPGEPKQHWASPAYAQGSTIWIHHGQIPKHHSNREPPAAFSFQFNSFKTDRLTTVLFGHEFGHTTLGTKRPHTTARCLMNPNGTDDNLCSGTVRAFESRYGIRPTPPEPPPFTPDAHLKRWEFLVRGGQLTYKNADGTNGNTLELENVLVIGTGGVLRDIQIAPVQTTSADPEAAEMYFIESQPPLGTVGF